MITLSPFVFSGFLAAALSSVSGVAHASLRVACLGDSITAGEKVAARTESYPAQLQRLLGTGFEVKNFGSGGATFWHGGSSNAFQQLPGATAFAPKLAIVMFGINDTRSRDVPYWSHFGEFEADASRVLETLLELHSQPRILLCLPTENLADLPGMSEDRRANVGERLPRLIEVRRKIAALAEKYSVCGVTLVDLHTPTLGRPEVYDPDGVHLNAAGYRLLAETLTPIVREIIAK